MQNKPFTELPAPVPDISQFYPIHNYPTNYMGSYSEIELKTANEGHISTFGKRTGLTLEDWPVYQLRSRSHSEIDGWLVALTPNGLKLLRKSSDERQAVMEMRAKLGGAR